MPTFYPKLMGKRVYLSPICLDNTELMETYTRWLNDAAVSDNLGISWLAYTPEKEKEALEEMTRNGYGFAIVCKNGEGLLGFADLHDLNLTSRNAQCGLFIGDAHNRSKGYGSESLALLLDFAFNTLNLNNVMLKLYAFNQDAYRCYEKLGFKEIGRRRQSYFIGGQYHDEIFMDILAHEFKASIQ